MSDTTADYFRSMYANDIDPWGFDHRWYERRKYHLTLAALPDERYRRAMEPGCANGALTEQLAARCDHVTAYDFEASAVERAQRRLRPFENVQVIHARFPDFWPHGGGDLAVWSEVAYYLADDSADRALTGLQRWLDVGGTLIAVHYTGTTDYPRQGSDVGPWLDRCPFLRRSSRLVDEDFELGVWRRVAQ